MASTSVRVLVALGAMLAGAATAAADFRSVGDAPAVGVDAPSARGKKTYIYSPGYPLEVIIGVDGWTKVRDASGEFAWLEDKAFGDRRTVLVKAAVADVRQAPDDSAPIAFHAEQNVLMELLDQSVPGWARVRLRDGQGGFVRIAQLWGA
jgi:SH3-like domain-containing protein